MRLRRLAVVLATAALVVFLAVAVFPTRTYLDQRDQISAEQAKVHVLGQENAKLAARVQELHTDAEIERLARQQYNLVRPGEEAYAILPGPNDPQPPAPAPPEPPAPAKKSLLDRLEFWR